MCDKAPVHVPERMYGGRPEPFRRPVARCIPLCCGHLMGRVMWAFAARWQGYTRQALFVCGYVIYCVQEPVHCKYETIRCVITVAERDVCEQTGYVSGLQVWHMQVGG